MITSKIKMSDEQINMSHTGGVDSEIVNLNNRGDVTHNESENGQNSISINDQSLNEGNVNKKILEHQPGPSGTSNLIRGSSTRKQGGGSLNLTHGSGSLNSNEQAVASPLHVDFNYMRAGSLGSLRTGISLDDSGLFTLPEQEPENPISFKSALEFIPKTFDGNNVPVSRFVRNCIYARNSIAAKNRQHLFLIIRSRISESAYNASLDRDIYTLEELLKALKDKYTAHRNLSQLNSTLATVSQKQNETVADYGDRVSEI